MMHRHTFIPLILFGFLLLSTASGFGQEEVSAAGEAPGSESTWHSDYDSAVKEAKKEGKNLMLVFTGTDWIEICRVFYDEILSVPEFQEAVSEKFVLVKLEYPKDNRLPREEATRKQLLKDAYRVRGYPYVILTDEKGRPFGLNGYQPTTSDAYATQILSMAKAWEDRLAILEDAESMEGLEKAKRLIAGIPDLPGNLSARYFRKEMEEVIALDPDLSLKESQDFRSLIIDVEYSTEMQRLARDVQWGKMILLTDSYIRESKLEGPRLQKALLNKADVRRQQNNLSGRIETLLQVADVDPESRYGKEAIRQLEELRARKLQEQLTE